MQRWGTGPQRGSRAPSVEGTQRRLRALTARSWTPGSIERATGVPAAVVSRALEHDDIITPRLAYAVARSYGRLWDCQPPCATQHEREAADAARAHAERRGWAPPMAWDDDQIDLPNGRPAPGWKPSERTNWRIADILEDARFVREHGGYRHATTGQVADRLGVTRDLLAHAYSRAGIHAGREAEPEAEAG